MSKIAWIAGTFAAITLGALGAETMAVFNSDEFKNAVKGSNKAPPTSLRQIGWEETEKLFVNVLHRKTAGELEAQTKRSKARLLVGFGEKLIPGHLPPTVRELANEELARDLMAREILVNGEGSFGVRVGNAFEAIRHGKMPEPTRGPENWWNRITGHSPSEP